ncbi:MAG TPA: hypothetical protein VNN08_13085 [Thermoanaerobaculia bacterium]|nr:hypothetical protein [Thermoanaerobaculia bacterium]
MLQAVEIRSIDRRRMIVVETFLGVPVDDEMGELFEIFFEGPDTKVGRQGLAVYHELIKSMRVLESDE